MKSAQEILEELYEPQGFNCQTPKQDLQIAITLNPDLEIILTAMERYAEQFNPQPVPELILREAEEVRQQHSQGNFSSMNRDGLD